MVGGARAQFGEKNVTFWNGHASRFAVAIKPSCVNPRGVGVPCGNLLSRTTESGKNFNIGQYCCSPVLPELELFLAPACLATGVEDGGEA
jgi:hypothetical protein